MFMSVAVFIRLIMCNISIRVSVECVTMVTDLHAVLQVVCGAPVSVRRLDHGQLQVQPSLGTHGSTDHTHTHTHTHIQAVVMAAWVGLGILQRIY